MLENHPALNDHSLASYAAWISLTRTLHEQNILDSEQLSRHLLSHFNALRACQQEGAAELVMEYRLVFEDMLKDSKDVS
ncbi:TPA_asm: hypothetical protein G0G78_25140 [Salmonella enterica]|nr:hypothetical protein [Salmonella enterica]EAO7618764.1 hypothetical protein [Salmonella enterica]EAQ6819303.1 hypothetical protein [Salmonella enterica]EAU9426850.1 hypothetical protein [Salmonella enterica]EBQ2131017.1 hypothetical protein [Salmonella enterica]